MSNASVCIVKKARPWIELPPSGRFWERQAPLSRVVCGKFLGLTTVKGGDVHNMMPAARVRAQGKTYVAYARDLKFKKAIR